MRVETQFVVMCKFRNYARLRRNGIVRVQIVMVGIRDNRNHQMRKASESSRCLLQ